MFAWGLHLRWNRFCRRSCDLSNAAGMRRVEDARQTMPDSCSQRSSFFHQTETEIIGWCADRAAAALPVAHEVGHECPVPALDHADAAIPGRTGVLTVHPDRDTLVAGRGPFPDIACEILEALRIGSIVTAGLRPRIGGSLGGRFLPVLPDPPHGRIERIIGSGREGFASEALGRRRRYLTIGWKPPRSAGGSGEPAGVGFGVQPTHARDRNIRTNILRIRRDTGSGRDAAA